MHTHLEILPPPPRDRIQELCLSLGLSPPLAQVLWHRGFREPKEARKWLDPDFSRIGDPFLFRDMWKAVDRIGRALRKGEPILVHGDYDVDGLSGTVLLLSFLKHCNAEVAYFIPSRKEGYGFTQASLRHIREGGFKVCISVDCGTSAHAEVREIQAGGCDVILTDHHGTGPEIAPAFAVLNPRLPDSGYPFPDLAGVGVAFKLAWALALSLSGSRAGRSELEALLIDAASLVALGSVADVVPLRGENRILVRAGLKALLQSRSPGIRALMDVLGSDLRQCSAEDISFRLGPRLNAAGRMGHASLAVELLTSASYGEARKLANKLEGLNRRRQKVEAEIFHLAVQKLDADPGLDRRRVLCVWGEDWHLGVLGIAAARLATKYGRPSLVLSVHEGQARGSGRSIHGLDLKALLDGLEGPEFHFGGHAFAVGLQLSEAELPTFAEALDRVSRGLELPAEVRRQVEARASLSHWTKRELKCLDRFRPFGQGNPPPSFLAEGVRIGAGLRRVGPEGRGLVFTALQDGVALKSLSPHLGHRIEGILGSPGSWNLVYTPRFSTRTETGPIELFVHEIESPSG